MIFPRRTRNSGFGIRHLPAIAVLCCILAAFVAAGPARGVLAAEPLPSQISDAEFWQMIVELSEPDGSFLFDNFLSNETTIQSVIPTLRAKTQPGGAYLGVGPEQNFTYIAALQPKIAFIVDIRRQNLIEHLMYKALFELSADRAGFVSRLFSRQRPPTLPSGASAADLFRAYESVPADREAFDSNLREIVDNLTVHHHWALSAHDLTLLTYVSTAFFREGPGLNYAAGGQADVSLPTYTDLMTQTDPGGEHHSFLASDDRYAFVKKLEADNLVIPVVGDFAGPTALRGVGRYLAAHDATITAFYLSNVERYLFDRRTSWRRFYATVAVLPYDDKSLFIRAILNRPASTLVTLLAPISSLVEAFEQGRVHEYQDVFSIANY